MALPIPGGNSRPSSPADAKSAPEEKGLPLPPQRRPQPASSLPKPKLVEKEPAEEAIPEGFARDEKTGIVYRKLPKTEYTLDGTPVLQIEDFDADNLNAEAESFLGHLRQAPSKEELVQLREERARKMRAKQDS